MKTLEAIKSRRWPSVMLLKHRQPVPEKLGKMSASLGARSCPDWNLVTR